LRRLQTQKKELLKLASEVSTVKQLVTQIAHDNKRDTQQIMGIMQELKNLTLVSQGKQQRVENRAAMQEFNTNVQREFAEIINKHNDKLLEKYLAELLTSINNGWSDRVNSSDDVAPELKALYTAVTKDLQNLDVNGFSRLRNLQSQTFSQHMALVQYLPKPSPSTQVTPTIYIDVDENAEVTGLAAYIMQSFLGAVRYDPKNISSSGIILTFIIVHDRLDMNRWVPICESRINKAAKHFVILVCNSLGDAARANGSEKLPCTALYKAAFDVQYDKSGMGRKPQQVYNKQSMDTCFAAIKSAM
jgi:hypothetical protein